MSTREFQTVPVQSTRMPPGIPFIVGNEAAERFSYYGMKAILMVYWTKYLRNPEGHRAVTTGLAIFGALLADLWSPPGSDRCRHLIKFSRHH